jgi:hypothetical protein
VAALDELLRAKGLTFYGGLKLRRGVGFGIKVGFGILFTIRLA